MVNSLAVDWLSGSEALDELDLTGAGKKKKKKKKKAKAPAAPIAGYDAATGAPVYDEIIGYDTRTGKPLYAQQEARRRAALAQAGGQTIVGYDDLGEPIYGPAGSAYPMQPGFAPAQPALSAIGQGSMLDTFAGVGSPYGQQTPPPPPGWSVQAWQQYLAAQQAAQYLQQGPQGQGTPLFAFIEDSGGSRPAGTPGFDDFESAGSAFYTGDEGGGFVDSGDFSGDLYGGGDDSPLFRATGAAAQRDPASSEGRARAAALLDAPAGQLARVGRGGLLSRAREGIGGLPMFGAINGSGCCGCEGRRKYPLRDTLRNPY